MNSSSVTRRSVLAAGAVVLGASTLIRPLRAAAAPVVVELFTSQGCSSCPPADAFMGNLVGRDGIIAISLNVDYWDYIGWRDTLASPAHTKRQRNYAARRGDGRVYTPQMVINGRDHAVGSDRGGVLRLIEKERRDAGHGSVAMSMAEDGKEIVVRAGTAGSAAQRQKSTLLMMTVTPEIAVDIERGENTGSKVTYYNVVRAMMPVGTWRGDEVEIIPTCKGGDSLNVGDSLATGDVVSLGLGTDMIRGDWDACGSAQGRTQCRGIPARGGADAGCQSGAPAVGAGGGA